MFKPILVFLCIFIHISSWGQRNSFGDRFSQEKYLPLQEIEREIKEHQRTSKNIKEKTNFFNTRENPHLKKEEFIEAFLWDLKEASDYKFFEKRIVSEKYLKYNSNNKIPKKLDDFFYKRATHWFQQMVQDKNLKNKELKNQLLYFDWFSEKSGDKLEAFYTEFRYWVGVYAEKSGAFEMAFDWYRMAALNGHPEAQIALANFYYTGVKEVVEPNFLTTQFWMNRALISFEMMAEQNYSPKIQFYLGVLYLYDFNTFKNSQSYKKVIQFFSKATQISKEEISFLIEKPSYIKERWKYLFLNNKGQILNNKGQISLQKMVPYLDSPKMNPTPQCLKVFENFRIFSL